MKLLMISPIIIKYYFFRVVFQNASSFQLIMQILICFTVNRSKMHFIFYFFPLKRIEDFFNLLLNQMIFFCRFMYIICPKSEKNHFFFFFWFICGCQNIKISHGWNLKICYLILFIQDFFGKNLHDKSVHDLFLKYRFFS